MLKKSDRCIVCGTKENLVPHHIIPCNRYDSKFYDDENGAVMCRACHTHYHQTACTITPESLDEFISENSEIKTLKRKQKEKSKRIYRRRKYERSPDYTKIRIRDFRADKPKKKKKSKSKKKLRFNPIYLSFELGCDDYSYDDKIQIERELLGDF